MLWMRVCFGVNSLLFPFFVCFHGRPWQATDVPQPNWLFVPPAFGRSNFGHQMLPRLPTRPTL
jgi:hypothetical protein